MQNLPFRRIVVKVGTKVVVGENSPLAEDRLRALVAEISRLWSQGCEVLLVSSGAIGLGRQVLPKKTKPNLAFRQACAAVGQNRLVNAYREWFSQHQREVAQILVTAEDFSRRESYLNLRDTFEELLALGVVPVINENDTTSTMELRERDGGFGDNDKLSALVASKLGAQLLILLTDVDGIYERNPKLDPTAKRITVVEKLTDWQGFSLEGKSDVGRGGMASKVEAARLASLAGVTSVIASGFRTGVTTALTAAGADGQAQVGQEGTWVLPTSRLSSRKHWIGFSSGVKGTLKVNEGAAEALENRNASLLAVGIVGVEGEFEPGDVVSFAAADGREIGRGVSNFSHADVQIIMGCRSADILQKLPHAKADVVIHRDLLAIYQEKKNE